MVNKETSIGIVGFGFVGKAVSLLAQVATTNIYDIADSKYSDASNRHKAYNADIIFINVPQF